LKHAQELTSQPAGIRGKIFDKLFETLEIKQLTEEEMETYNKSILKYRDVRSAVELALERGVEKGVERGMQQGLEKGIRITAMKCLEEGMSIELICRITGLTPGQIKQIR
jgi:predicted transposase/invertase (TIGR01784 family)